MSARVAILMVKNSRSFELTKIRHYQDQPYCRLFAPSKGSTPGLPLLREWQDEALGGALAQAPASIEAKEELNEPAKAAESEKPRKRPAAKKQPSTRRATRAADAEPDPIPIISKLTPQRPKPAKALSLGAEPQTAPGESCRILDVLKASETVQEDEFKAVVETASELRQTNLRLSVETLVELQSAFGDDARRIDI